MVLPLLALSLLTGAVAQADPFEHGGYASQFRHVRGGGPGWHPHHLDIDAWHGGRWFHGYHGDRLGWWWIAAGTWFLYDAPVYPYPVSPAVVMLPPPTVQVAPPAPVVQEAPVQSWYFCRSKKQYYPYVEHCPEGWKTVPATPPER